MKKMIIMSGIMLAMFNLYSEPKPNVEAIMYVDTEMPCLKEFERLSGRIIIRNNGEDDVKVMGRTPDFPEMLVYFQLFLFPDISVQEEEQMTARPAESPHIRARIKRDIDAFVKRNEDIITIQKGESFETAFENINIKVPHGAYNRCLSFVAELYLSPDTWIPVEIRPRIMVACDAKITAVTVTKSGVPKDINTPWVYRAQIGTNEVLLVRENHIHYRLSDLHPDDVVVHSNKVITITQKNGTVRTIPEADIPRISAERTEEKRKARELETKN